MRILGIVDTIDDTEMSAEVNTKCKKLLTYNIQKIQDIVKISNLRVVEREEGDCYQFKGPESFFNKMIEENILNLKTETAINVQEVYNT